jgi:capsid portal protein
MNRLFFPEMGIQYHRFRSNSPNTTDNTQLVAILSGAEKTGGMTPRIARNMLEEILGDELPQFPKDFPADLPFSMLMAEAVKNKADPTEPGQQVTAIKRLKEEDFLSMALRVRERLEKEWQDATEGSCHDHGTD